LRSAFSADMLVLIRKLIAQSSLMV